MVQVYYIFTMVSTIRPYPWSYGYEPIRPYFTIVTVFRAILLIIKIDFNYHNEPWITWPGPTLPLQYHSQLCAVLHGVTILRRFSIVSTCVSIYNAIDGGNYFTNDLFVLSKTFLYSRGDWFPLSFM